MNQLVTSRSTWSNTTPIRVGLSALAFFVCTVGVWGTQTSISGAVVASGQVQVAPNKTAIEHLKAGIVADLLVEDGQRVEKGDVVVRLDDTELRSRLEIVEAELFETLADSARLMAIIDDRTELILDPLLAARLENDPEVAVMVGRQQQQLLAFYESVSTTEQSLEDQIKEVENQINGAGAELDSKLEKLEFVGEEIDQMNENLERGLVRQVEVQNLQKEKINTEGEIARLETNIASLKQKRLEIELRLRNHAPALKQQSAGQLNRSQRESAKFLEQRKGILEDLNRLEIRTPISGTIHDSRVLGLRSVVKAGSPLMFVVPEDEPVAVSARVEAGDIDEVALGQNAMVKFTAFNARELPNIFGTVSNVSPDAFLDPKTRRPYYTVVVELSADEIDKLGENTLISGMPVTVYLTTTARSPMGYVTRPISLYLDRALRD